MKRGQTLELFSPEHEEFDRKELQREQPAQVQSRDSLDTQKVGTADGEASRRSHQHPASHEQRAPRLLLRQEQQRPKKGRPRLSRSAVLEREAAHCCTTTAEQVAARKRAGIL